MKIYDLNKKYTAIFNQFWMLDEDDQEDKLEFDRLTAELENLIKRAEKRALFYMKVSKEKRYSSANKKDAAEKILKRAKTDDNAADRFESMALSTMQRFDVSMVEDAEVRLKRFYPAAAVVVDDSIDIMTLPDGCIKATATTTDRWTIKELVDMESIKIDVKPIKSELKKLLTDGVEWSQGIGLKSAEILPGVYAVKTETLRVS